MTITENERKLMIAIRDSEYQEYDPDDPESGKDRVWVDCMWGFEGKKKFGGVMASLSVKGFAGTDGETCWLTDAGLAAIADIPKTK